ncbi:DEAD/DEAH box helicase [Rhizorhabdus histidinilytica]|uniref:ATP-dependent RNA helicase DeaD n=1 Tax=Rhizorhabdus histidinilytica TaxID=439228 RepID=A0A1T5AV77_9SPHN|nr:DEAD/DEAH box helicase [Rhizorhabdus histidinilytica]SKB38941.1 ATP-dependent RNA helicase DeaD [Rhizorhabdus histidinilytica]
MPFSSLPRPVAEAITERGYTAPTPVQAQVIAAEAHDRDLLVSAQTGSGKTVAYGLAIAETLLQGAESLPRAGEPLALIIAPTRELALQVQRELQWLYAKLGARVVSCVGGMNVRVEQRQLSYGCHIVVGTPGRLRDHLERGALQPGSLRAVILDEADEMLDLGFREDLEEILDMTPPERRTLLFSATMPKPIAVMAKRYQRDALRIETTSERERHADIDYRAVAVAPGDIEHAVVNLLRFHEAKGTMIFCATRENVRRLSAALTERGFAAVTLSGELSQNERNHALQALRDRRARVCVATDVAARGIDLPGLELVIHAELPIDAETLQHRSGRTGRAGRKGTCVLIVPYTRRRHAERLLRGAHVQATWDKVPTAEDIYARDEERLVDSLEVGEVSDEDLAVARKLLETRSAEEIAAAFVRSQRQSLPAPEELADAAPVPQAAREQGPRPGFEDTAWFRINAGRNDNADPRWLLPLICRHGHITKRDVGAIRIFSTETRFEIPRGIAAKFLSAVKKSGGEQEGVLIEPAGDAPPPPRNDRRGPPRDSRGPRPGGRPPYKAGPGRGAPRRGGPRG